MARSKSFFGLRRGSTKSHTYSVANGQQVTKDRVWEVKNPRTYNQMLQRMFFSTLSAAYNKTKAITDHSFEGVTYGAPSMNHFRKINANAMKQPKAFLNAWGNKNLRPNALIIAQGSIAPAAYSMSNSDGSQGAVGEFVGTPTGVFLKTGEAGQNAPTIGAFLDTLDIRSGYVTLVWIAVDPTQTSEYGSANTIAQPNNGSFYYARLDIDTLALHQDEPVSAIPAILNAKGYESNTNGFNLSYEPDEDTGYIVLDTFSGNKKEMTAFAVIKSTKADDKWLRSDATLAVNPALNPETQLLVVNTYPIGESLYLNGGEPV